MLCENCNQKQATVHVQKIMNGEKIENHYCTNCAQLADINLSFNNLFQGFLSSFFEQKLPNIPGDVLANQRLKCPNCSMTYSDFKNSGRLGCNQCYDAFRNELNFAFKNIQASNRHQGKIPEKSGSKLKLKRDIEKLKENLAHAIEVEEYEKAANLRDEIRRLGGNSYE